MLTAMRHFFRVFVARATIGESEITVRDGIKAADLEAEADAAEAEGDTARAEALRAEADREAAVEQVLINLYCLSKNGGSLINKINSISKVNKTTSYEQALVRGAELLRQQRYPGF